MGLTPIVSVDVLKNFESNSVLCYTSHDSVPQWALFCGGDETLSIPVIAHPLTHGERYGWVWSGGGRKREGLTLKRGHGNGFGTFIFSGRVTVLGDDGVGSSGETGGATGIHRE